MKRLTAIALSAALMGGANVAMAADAGAGKSLFQSKCASCHGMQAQGQGMFPKLAGKSVEEVTSKLKAYRAGEQVGPQTSMMAPMAQGLSDADIANVAAYVSGL